MKSIYASSFALLSIGASLTPVVALPSFNPPRVPRGLPDGTQRIAIDDDTGDLIAFGVDGKQLGVVPPEQEGRYGNVTRRGDAAGACAALSTDDLKRREYSSLATFRY
jgi:hypothetical protein